jgi:hypothetical protein
MFTIGQSVQVVGVFSRDFTLTYTITEVTLNSDGSTVYLLDQGAGGFDAIYLEAV